MDQNEGKGEKNGEIIGKPAVSLLILIIMVIQLFYCKKEFFYIQCLSSLSI